MLSWNFVMDLIMLGIKPKTMRPFVIADHSACAILLFTLWHWPHSSNTMQRQILMIIEPSLTAAIIRFDQKCLLALRSPFCYSPFVLYFYTTELNQGTTLLMQSDFFYLLIWGYIKKPSRISNYPNILRNFFSLTARPCFCLVQFCFSRQLGL